MSLKLLPSSFVTADAFTLKFSYKQGSNLDPHIRWLEYLLSDEYQLEIQRRFESVTNQREARRITRSIIDTLIYQAYPDPGTRTGNLHDSFKVIVGRGQKKSAYLAVYSDPRVATTKTGVAAGFTSYAAFFENPEFDSFLPPKEDPTSPSKYRPFFQFLSEEIHRFTATQAHAAHTRTIKRRIPKKQ